MRMTLRLARAILHAVDPSRFGPALRRAPEPANTPVPSAPLDLDVARAIIDARLFWTEYEPLVDRRTLRVTAYEALARFRRLDGLPVSTGALLGVLHAENPLLLRAELELKRHQLEHAPATRELFVNLDPDSWDHGRGTDANPLLTLLSGAPSRVVVEVIENMDATDAILGRDLVATLKSQGLPVALDDVGATNGLLSFEALEEAEVLKFDRSLLQRLGKRQRRRAFVDALVRTARQIGVRTVLEGVETTADLALARELGVDLVQGFLFRDRCIQAH